MKSCLDHFSFLLPSRFLCQFAVLFSISSLACSLLSCCCILTKKSFSSKGGMHEGRRPLKQSLFGMKKHLVIVILLGTRHFFKFWVTDLQVRENLMSFFENSLCKLSIYPKSPFFCLAFENTKSKHVVSNLHGGCIYHGWIMDLIYPQL